ncbi:hypothetical protein LSH36_146g03019 [Paralvinella palmiformis]|uniref:G-protein coupled receptors family 1 profile domain-containing protein n=1 Tax=Paralvinella palmiformis TaxID=53620 RepID=A0AAD9N8X5_9ANNE|nr:hypothetical protein LSH36_146g03019 [Paralvinella palmiformis]
MESADNGNQLSTLQINVTMTTENNSRDVISYEENVSLKESEIDCRTFLFVIYVVVFGMICVFGLIGNTLSFLVLQWEKHGHVATFLLQVMALIDNLFLLTTGFSQIYSATGTYFGWLYDPVQPFIQMLVWPLVHITQLGTVWITVLIAFNRYIAICKPFQAPKLCTMSRVRLQVILMVGFCVLYCVPRFFEYRIAYVHDVRINRTVPIANITSLLENDYYKYIYENGLYTLIVFLAPLVMLVMLNACLIRELWRARQRALQRQMPAFVAVDDQENNLTLVMVVIILVFVMCQTPALINNMLFVLAGSQYVCGRPYFYYFHISNLLVSANSAVNFVIYCIFRKQFRERLRAFCHKEMSLVKYSQSTSNCHGQTTTVYTDNCYPTKL